MDLPFDGGISRFFADSAPNAVRDAINGGKKTKSSTQTTHMQNG